MTKTRTNEITQAILEFLLRGGVFVWRNNTTGVFDVKRGIFRPAPKSGAPDIIGIIPGVGKFLGVEVKVGSDRIRETQESFGENVRCMNGIYMVVGSLEEFKNKYDEVIRDIFTK